MSSFMIADLMKGVEQDTPRPRCEDTKPPTDLRIQKPISPGPSAGESTRCANGADLDRVKRERQNTEDDSSISSGRSSPTDSEIGVSGENRRSKKARTAFSAEQVAELERRYQLHKYLPAAERVRLADRLGMADQQVKTWFQNRRMKEKREVREQGHGASGLMYAQLPAAYRFHSVFSPLPYSPGSPIPLPTLPPSLLTSPYSVTHPLVTSPGVAARTPTKPTGMDSAGSPVSATVFPGLEAYRMIPPPSMCMPPPFSPYTIH